MKKRLLLSGAVTCLMLFMLPTVCAFASWEENGTPIAVAPGFQHEMRITSDGAGGAIIAWEDDDLALSDPDIRARRVNAFGDTLWTGNGVPICTATGRQEEVQIISDGTGGAIMVWQDGRGSGFDIYAQRVDSSGVALWEEDGKEICAATSHQMNPQITSDGVGGAIITWEDYRGGSYMEIYAQRVDEDGIGLWTADGVPVVTGTDALDFLYTPQIASDGAEGAIITVEWTRSGNSKIRVQRVDDSGAVLWTGGGVVVSAAPGDQCDAQIISDGAGGGIITWEYGSGVDIYAQRVNASGDIMWTGVGVVICESVGPNTDSRLTSDGAGGAIIAWSDVRNGNSDVYAQRADSAGTTLWQEDGEEICTAPYAQWNCELTSDSAGGAIITWEDYRGGGDYMGVYAQRVDGDGDVLWPEDGVALCISEDNVHFTVYPRIVSDGASGAIITWMDTRGRPERDGFDVYAQRVTANGGVGLPACGVAPLMLSFGLVPVGGYLDKTFVITNTDLGLLEGTVSEACDYYEIVGDASYSLLGGESDTTTVRFQPLSPGTHNCVIETGHGICSDVLCLGATPPECSVEPVAIDFGAVSIGSSRDTMLVITNIGGGMLSGTVSEACEGYEIVGDPLYSLPAGESDTITVRFEPATFGTLTCLVETGSELCSDVSCIGVGYEPWTDVTSGPLGDTGQSRGVAWGDYDGDGDLDLYLSNTPSANRLFCNEGGGVFSDSTGGPLGDAGQGMGVAWGDYDNDGDLDLYLSNGGSDANKLFRNDGGGTFVDATSGPLGNADGGGGIAWGDYDNDGDVDLYLAIGGGNANKLLRNDGGGTFVDATSGPLGDTESSVNVIWGDYDNDGDLDLYVSNVGTDASKLLRNDGSGVFTDVTSGPLGNVGTGAGVAWGDYDNDGDLDLYLANYLTSNKLFRNDGGGTFVDATSGPLGDTGPGRGVAWGDYDNDGDLDLFVTNLGASDKLFRNDGGGTFVDVTSGPLGDTGYGTGVAWGDYDNDGDLDLYVARYSQANRLYRNNLSSGDQWLHVDLEGVYSNRVGIGARIRVVTGSTSQIREVSGGSGDMSQNSLTAEFGLGAVTVVDTVQVVWPSGIVQDSLNVAPNQLVVITERESPVGVADRSDAPVVDFLSQSYPNPFNPLTHIAFSVAVPGEVALRVYDISGRPVRTLVEGWKDAQRYEVTWDGRDGSGKAVASGVYFYQLEAPGYIESKKMILLK